MKNGHYFIFLIGLGLFLHSFSVMGQDFKIIPLGIYGGGDESNLSAYLVSQEDENAFLSLDAGTLRAGIIKAVEKGTLQGNPEKILQQQVKGYFISHGHLDHLAGLIINSPDDSKKNIYALPFTIDILKNRYFTNDAWSNFANEGDEPQIGTYTYQPKENGEKFAVANTALTAQIFELSHINPYKSSALLVTNTKGNSILYFGDTGADRIEKTDKLSRIWTAIAPLVRQQKLKAILIETSFDNSRDENLLFGHLTPKLLHEELQNLAKKAGLDNLSGLKVVITHLKPGGEQIEKIKHQYQENNPMQVDFIFPEQGVEIDL